MTHACETQLSDDLAYILDSTRSLWENLRNKRVLITGGTGFFGCWFLESFLWANQQLNLQAQAVILSRNPSAFRQKYPHLAQDSALDFHAGDVRNFTFPSGPFDYVIHAATDASVELNAKNPVLMWDTVLEGTRRVLDFCHEKSVSDMLMISSGAVYGQQAAHIEAVSEEECTQLNAEGEVSAYAASKLAAEMLCNIYARQYQFKIKIARCFAFVGPYLPIDTHFAIGNFIKHGLQGETITVHGDGTPYRSYLYAADLMIWLWTILFQGQSLRPYNVGSDEAYSIRELSQLVAGSFSESLEVNILGQSAPHTKPARYVPDIRRSKQELNLAPQVSLVDAIERTIRWHATLSEGVK